MDLTTICTPNCNIHIIPCDIDQFYYVRTIHLDDNSISHIPNEVLFKNLRYLSLPNNMITILPRNICYLNLSRLYISGNKLANLPKEIWHLIKKKL